MRVVRQLTLEEARARPRLPPLAVLPDAARVEERLVSLAQPFVAGRRACTVAELERDVVRAARAASACPRVAAPEALALAVQRACREATPRGSPFHRIREQPGFARAAQDLLAALAQGLLEPAELDRLDLPDGARERIAPLAAVLVDVRERLARRGLVDANGALHAAVVALERGIDLPPSLAQAARVTFEWILDWTPLRVRLAAALAARLGPGRVVVRLPWPGDRPELREALDPALRAFEALGGTEAAPDLELFDPAEGSQLAPFLARLFSPCAGDHERPVALRACASPAAQAREVAGACADLLAQGAAPESIAVVARSLAGGAAEELGAAFDRLGVPWRERRGRPALPAPPSQLALSLYDACERRFPRGAIELLLSSQLLWIPDEGDRLPAHVLVRTLRQAHVRDDASDGGYAARLDALASRVQAKAEGDCSRALAEIAETKRRVQGILDALRALPARATLREHGAALLALLDRWGLPRRLRRGEGDDPGALGRAAVAALARDQAALAALEDACEALARGAEALGESDLLWSRTEWAQALASALADASLPPRGARGGAVQLCELRELAGRRFDHVLVVGLVDGELPARPPVDPLLSDDDRRAVNRAAGRAVFRAAAEGAELSLLPPRQVEEPLLFLLGLCAAQRSVALFWARQDAQGREVLRSPFVDEAVRALGLSADEEKQCAAPLSPVPALESCRSPGELLARAAIEAFAEPAWRVAPPVAEPTAYGLAAAVSSSKLAPRMKAIARAALAERERLRAFVRDAAPGRFSGGLSGAALQAVRADLRFGPEKPLSAHQLEEHATCGFRTFAHRLLRIEVDEPGEDDLDARDRGSLLHRCLEAFFARMRDAGRLPLRGDAQELAVLREVAQAEMDAFAREEHVGRVPLWEIRRAEVLQSLEALVVAEARQSGHPVEFERRFGYAGEWDALRIPDPEGREIVFVRGAIDRLDRGADRSLLVIDYKSSRKQNLARKLHPDWLLHPEFQLALYAALVRQQEPRTAVDAVYVSLRDAERTATLRAKTAGEVDFDQLLEMDPARRARLRESSGPPLNLADAVWARVRAMRSGLFPVAPLSCDFCELKPVCRLVALPTDPDENGGEVPRV